MFGQTTGYQFVNFDDGGYVYDNPQISGGLTARGIAWVFTHEHVANWHPLTGLSHLLDCQLFGLNAGAHHVTNVLLHAATAVLLFLVLWRMTGGFWPSAMVAALFAVHPLRVESVAWISERKDVLSGLFFVLTLAAYVWYVRSPFSLGRYLLLAVVFALGLMAKPMLVTLPLVLLLLDYWPLGRFAGGPCLNRPPLSVPLQPETPAHGNGEGFTRRRKLLETVLSRFPFPWRLVMEKLPLLLLVAVSCLLTLWAQGSAAALNLVSPWQRESATRWSPMCLPGSTLLAGGIGRVLSPLGRQLAGLEGSRFAVGVGVPLGGRTALIGGAIRISLWAGCGMWGCSCP